MRCPFVDLLIRFLSWQVVVGSHRSTETNVPRRHEAPSFDLPPGPVLFGFEFQRHLSCESLSIALRLKSTSGERCGVKSDVHAVGLPPPNPASLPPTPLAPATVQQDASPKPKPHEGRPSSKIQHMISLSHIAFLLGDILPRRRAEITRSYTKFVALKRSSGHSINVPSYPAKSNTRGRHPNI